MFSGRRAAPTPQHPHILYLVAGAPPMYSRQDSPSAISNSVSQNGRSGTCPTSRFKFLNSVCPRSANGSGNKWNVPNSAFWKVFIIFGHMAIHKGSHEGGRPKAASVCRPLKNVGCVARPPSRSRGCLAIRIDKQKPFRHFCHLWGHF